MCILGVKPPVGDWSTQNALFFKTLVGDKDFSSSVMEVKPDKTLCLDLYISGEDGFVVSTRLIDECPEIAI